nr:reverse transcriptase domain-containing protein [Tanacetum cinerariifolium]
DLYNYDPNAYSFDNSNYFSQPQDENYLCNLCGNNSHDGYDCQQQFPFIYEQEPSYNQNYDDNYYPHESLSFPCYYYCGGSHETFQCQPDNQNIDFSSSDQIQTSQYPDVNPPSLEISNEEIFQAKGDLMKSIQTFLERFNCIPFEEKPQILFLTWETFFAIQCSQPEDSNELFQKLLKDLKELVEYDQSTSTDRPIFLKDNKDHHVQNRESPENSFEENVVSKTNQEPPQDSNMHQLIEECSVEVPDAPDSKLILINSINSQRLDKKEQEVKNVEEQPVESRNHIEKSLQNFRVIHKSSISLNTSQISSIHLIAPILSTKEPENSLSMGYEPLSITPETESDKVTESNAENLLSIPSECEVTLEDKRECDELICENSSTIDVCDNHSEILFDSNNDDLSSDDESFEDIEYVDASVPDLAIASVEENELLIDDSILSHEPSDSNFEVNPSNSRPPPEPPDDNFDLEPEVISAVMKDNDKPDEYFNLGGEIFVSTNNEDVDYFPFMFVIPIFLPYLILPEISPLFLSAESEDMIFDPEWGRVYENSLIYKERTKKLHDDKIKNRIFNVGDQVLLFNSRLKIFSGKLKFCWSGPFTISEIYPYGTAQLIHPDGCNFKVNCHRLKHYHGGDPPPLEI